MANEVLEKGLVCSMINPSISVKKVMDVLIPISRFNRGEANKIFDEVKEHGVRIVMKNNDPACVLIDPQKYEAMIEALEEYELYFEAKKRMKNISRKDLIPAADVMSKIGVANSDLDEIEVDID